MLIRYSIDFEKKKMKKDCNGDVREQEGGREHDGEKVGISQKKMSRRKRR